MHSLESIERVTEKLEKHRKKGGVIERKERGKQKKGTKTKLVSRCVKNVGWLFFYIGFT